MLMVSSVMLLLCFVSISMHKRKEGIEKLLERHHILAATYQEEMVKLVQAGYVLKLSQDQVDSFRESWFIPHHMVHHNGNRVVFNCSFSYEGHNLNEFILPALVQHLVCHS